MTFDSEPMTAPNAAATWLAPPIKPQIAAGQFNPNALARECATKAKYDTTEAAQMLLRRLQTGHPDFYAEKVREALMLWAIERVKEAAREVRSQIAAAEPRRSVMILSAESLKDLAASWLDWPVRPGIPLRDATKEILQSASAVYLRDANIYSARGNFYAAIANALPNAKVKVHQALDEKAIAKLAVDCRVTKE